jgi:hypothetical protein
MLRRKAPKLTGAPAVPGQRSWVRFVMENGICVGVWVYDGNEESGVELPVTNITREMSANAAGTYTFTVPAEYVSEAP